MAGEITYETYTTVEDDMVDLIAWRRFGSSRPGAAILDANPVLAQHGPRLPAGLALRIPIPVVTDRAEAETLWS